ncbi:uncharacterized protein [Argopecten irradians]|uniref:uncharacterized protein n=1 Tax=Argopecten irradians TaxID=31199 RepID=UPI0037140FB6
MQGKTIYRLEPRLKSTSRSQGNIWTPNAAITENALSRRLGELDKEKTLFQADYRYRQRELQRELETIRASKHAVTARRDPSRRFSSRHPTDPKSITSMIDRFKKKRTDQEYLQDQLRQRRDSLVSCIGTKSSTNVFSEDDSDISDSERYTGPKPPSGTILHDMHTALAKTKPSEGLTSVTNEAGERPLRESRKRKPTYPDATFPRGLSHWSNRRRLREGSRIKKRESKEPPVSLTMSSPSTKDEDGECIEPTRLTESETKVDASDNPLPEDDNMLSITHNPNQTSGNMKGISKEGLYAETNEHTMDKYAGPERENKQLLKKEFENTTNIITRRCSEPVTIGKSETFMELSDNNTKTEYVPEEILPSVKDHKIVRRFSENDKYQCNFIKDLIEDHQHPKDNVEGTKEMTESDVIWDDVRRCRYLRGYDPPIMIMPKEEINLFVFGRDENDILELQREKHFGL